MRGRFLVCVAALSLACGTGPPPEMPGRARGFSASLPALVKAVHAEEDDNLDQAFGLFEGALPYGVRSRELFLRGALVAAVHGAPDTAFGDLESMRRLGIADVAMLESEHQLIPLHHDPRWAPLLAAVRASSADAHDPEKAKIVTDDIDRFWSAYDDAKHAGNAVAIYDREYVDRASPGLQGFFALKIGATSTLAANVSQYWRYYESVRKSTGRVRDLEPQFRVIFRKLQQIMPEATFPDVTFVIGALTSGGTSTADGLVIGAEQACRTAASPVDTMSLRQRERLGTFEGLPHVVAHELAHFQQHFLSQRSLLEQALKEGGADFVAELVSGDVANADIRAYGDAHEAALWNDFQYVMGSANDGILRRWIASKEATPERPGDLGYYVGYRIARAYYESHADKRRALRDLLDVTDAKAFLAASGYAPK